MNEIVMPKLSDTMTEGRLISWKKQVGETVRRGDVLAEVETDKANMELEAFTAGVLLEIKVQAGEMAQVGTVIALIGKPEEKGAGGGERAGAPQPPKVEPEPKRQAEAPRKEQAPSAAAQPPGGEGAPSPVKPGAEGEAQAPAAPLSTAGETQAPAKPVEAPAAEPQPAAAQGQPQQPAQAAESRERAAPVVRRRARELGIDLSQVKGSGPDGRILLHDLESRGAAPAEPGKEPSAEARAPAEESVKPLSRLRSAVARIVTESWESIPHFTVTMDVVMDEAESVRRQLKQAGHAVTVTDLLVKGVALALQKFPQLNASFAADGMHQHAEVNVGVAVGVQDGVLVPVIRGCERLTLLEITRAGRQLVEKARSGSLSEQEMSGGTFSISNMGMYGITQFSAIIYPNQSGVLAVGAVVDTPVLRAGAAASAKVMKVTLSADHRLIDGAYAAQFLVGLKEIMENPVRLLL